MSRLDKLKEQHPQFNVSIIDILASIDPTKSYKYVEFLIKRLKSYYETEENIHASIGVELIGIDNTEQLNEFEKHCKAGRIKKNDISTYNSWKEIRAEVVRAEEIVERKKLEKQVLKIYEDDIWLVITPLSYEASKIYGSNTKWCTTQEKYWNNYLPTHRLIYVINKKTNNKVAFSRSNNQFKGWTEDDTEVSPLFFDFIPDEVFLKIRKELNKDVTTQDLINFRKGKTPKESEFLNLVEKMDINSWVMEMLTGKKGYRNYNDYEDFLQ